MNVTPEFLAQFGVIGIMLYWFMFRVEKKLESVDDLSKMIGLFIIAQEKSETIKKQVQEVLDRIGKRGAMPFVMKRSV